MEENEDEKESEETKAAGANGQGLKRSLLNSPVSISSI